MLIAKQCISPFFFADTASCHRTPSLLQNQIITFGKKPGPLARNINALYDPITAIKCLSMNTALLQCVIVLGMGSLESLIGI